MSKKNGNGNGNTGVGKLFYAVVLADRELDFGAIGLGDEHVNSVNFKEICALVSDHPRVDSIKLLRKNLAPYYRVVNEAAKRFTTIPAKFGQIARDAGEVALALRANYAGIRHELSRLDGRVEMGLRAWWNVDNVMDYLISRDSVLRRRRDQLLSGGATLNRMAQIEFGEFCFGRLNSLRQEMTGRILSSIPPGEARKGDVHDDKMILNSQLLISRDLQEELGEAVNRLTGSLGGECRIEFDGPWPPFSFVDHLAFHLER